MAFNGIHLYDDIMQVHRYEFSGGYASTPDSCSD